MVKRNKCLSSASSISDGSKNQIKKAASFSFIDGGFKNKMKEENGLFGGGEKIK